MNFLSQYGLFLLKTATLIVGILIVFTGIILISRQKKDDLTITSLNKEYDELKQRMLKEICDKKDFKAKNREKKKKSIKNSPEKYNLYVIDFSGDIKASEVEPLRTVVTAVLSTATPKDEIMIRLESPGGSVNGYGLAAAQLQRIRDKGIPLTVCIDKVAASGGYLMACVANKIIAAPFAIIGSIGVVAQMPNFHRWLKKHDVDVELLTAGEYKRTLTMFSENTEKGRQKFQEDLERIHQVFRDYVLGNRQEIDIHEVSTGEHWLAKDAVALKLVDHMQTSDEYILNHLETRNIYAVSLSVKEPLLTKLTKPLMNSFHPFG